MIYNIEHLKNLLENNFDLLPKSLGVELVDLGFLRYEKLTPENYNYWWYEVDNIKQINKNTFTYSWNDMVLTRKANLLIKFIDYHENDESMYNLITPILNIEFAKNDGFDIKTGKLELLRVIDFYYGHKLKKNRQLELGCSKGLLFATVYDN